MAHHIAFTPTTMLGTLADPSARRLSGRLLPTDGGNGLLFPLLQGAVVEPEEHVVGASATQFLVAFAWRGDGGSDDLYGVRVGFDGGLLDGPFQIAGGPGVEVPRSIASNGTDFLVSYQVERAAPDGGTQRTVGFRPVFADSTLGGSPGVGIAGELTELKTCFNGTRYIFVVREVITDTRSRLYVGTMSSNFANITLPTNFSDEWAFDLQLACAADGRSTALWSQWNFITAGNASVLEQPFTVAGTPVGGVAPVSHAGEYQSISSMTSDWLVFQTPRDAFATPTDGQPDASVVVPFYTRVSGNMGDEHLWLFTDPSFSAERRTVAGQPIARMALPSISDSAFTTSLSTAGPDWAIAWSFADVATFARVGRDGGVSTQIMSTGGSVGDVVVAVNTAGDGVTAWEDRPSQVINWARTRSGGTGRRPANYYSHPAIAALGARFLLAWDGQSDGLVGTWIEADGFAPDAGLLFSTPGIENSAAIACGPTECLLTWVRGNASWDLYGRMIFLDGSMGPVTPLITGPNAELNPHPAYVSPGLWRLGFDRYEPSLATRRAYVVDLIEPVDGGTSLDAGTSGDAGVSVDAGATDDAGNPVVDVDAGSPGDAGTEQQPQRVLSVGCGCSALEGPLALVWLLLWRRRANHKPAHSSHGVTSVLEHEKPTFKRR